MSKTNEKALERCRSLAERWVREWYGVTLAEVTVRSQRRDLLAARKELIQVLAKEADGKPPYGVAELSVVMNMKPHTVRWHLRDIEVPASSLRA